MVGLDRARAAKARLRSDLAGRDGVRGVDDRRASYCCLAASKRGAPQRSRSFSSGGRNACRAVSRPNRSVRVTQPVASCP